MTVTPPPPAPADHPRDRPRRRRRQRPRRAPARGAGAEDLRRGQGRRLRPRRRRAGRGLRRERRRRARASPTSARVSDSASAGSPRRSSSIRTRCPRPRPRPSPTASIPTLVDLDGARAYAEAAAGPLRRVRQDRRRARAAGRAGRAGGEDRSRPCWSCRTCAWPGSAPTRTRQRRRSRLRRVAARPVHRGRRRAGSARRPRADPAVRRLAVRAAVPADLPQRGRSRADALRHHVPGETSPVPLRPTLRALATRVIALKELTPRERFAELAPFPVTGAHAAGRDPRWARPTAWPWLHAGRVLVRRAARRPSSSRPQPRAHADRPDRGAGRARRRRGGDHRPPGRRRDHRRRGGHSATGSACTTWPPPSGPRVTRACTCSGWRGPNRTTEESR